MQWQVEHRLSSGLPGDGDLFLARLGLPALGPTCEVKVEVCGWEGKQQHLIYQDSTRLQAALKERFTSPVQQNTSPRASPPPPPMVEALTPTQERRDPH